MFINLINQKRNFIEYSFPVFKDFCIVLRDINASATRAEHDPDLNYSPAVWSPC